MTSSDAPTAAAPTPTASTQSPTTAVLRDEETARTRGFARAIVLICILSTGLHHFTPPSLLHRVMTAAIVTLGMTAGLVWHSTYRSQRWMRTLLHVFGLEATAMGILLLLYFGVFSGVTVLVVFVVWHFGLGEDRRWVFVLVALFLTTYVGMAVAIAAGLVPDTGLFAPRGVPRSALAGLTGIVVSVMAATLWQARNTRRATQEAIERAARAAREARDREVQMIEAQQELDRLARAGAGHRGRYSDVVLDGWRLGEVIGRGAMGEVYEARRATDDTSAAVKLLHPNQDEQIVRRFLREMDIASKLRGPHLVHIHGVGTAADGTPFLVMERLVGRDLASMLREQTRLTIEATVTLVDHVARGLGVAHAAGVVHRDLKPQNLFLAERPGGFQAWTVLDFGIAHLEDSSGTLTEGHVVGTPQYMSPEQALGKRIDHRADLYALGAVAYRVLTGELPFAGSTMLVFDAVVRETPMRPRELRPDLPHDVEHVLAICLAKKPDDRFTSAAELATAMGQAAAGNLAPEMREQGRRIVAASPWRSGAIR